MKEAVVEGIDNPKSSLGIIASPVGAVDSGGGGCFAKCLARLGRGAGEEVDGFFLHLVESKSVVVVVADDDITIGIEGEMLGAVELGSGARATVSGVAFFAGGVDESVKETLCIDMAESVSFPRGDEEGAIGSVNGSPGADERREGRFLAILWNAAFPGSGDGFHRIRGEIDLEDFELSQICDEELVVIGVKRDGVRFFEGELAIAQRRERFCFEVDDTDAAVEGIGDEETSIGVEGQVVHAVEASFESGSTVSFSDVAEVLARWAF